MSPNELAHKLTGHPVNQTQLSVKVIPLSSKNCIVGWFGNSLKIKVQAPPEKGKANHSVIKILAKVLGIDSKFMSIISGETSTNKVFIINGLSKDNIHQKIADHKY